MTKVPGTWENLGEKVPGTETVTKEPGTWENLEKVPGTASFPFRA